MQWNCHHEDLENNRSCVIYFTINLIFIKEILIYKILIQTIVQNMFNYFGKNWMDSYWSVVLWNFTSSHPEVFLRKVVLKKCSKFRGEHPCRSAISIMLKSHFGIGVLLYICCIFSEHHFFRTPLGSCFWNLLLILFKGDSFITLNENDRGSRAEVFYK